jgi:DNA-directed RNA polymerase subunit RPC12/RpoP
MPLDHLPNIEGQMQRESFRQKHYPYIYYCANCVRAYLARDKEDVCKFCQGPVMILTGGKRYIYFCERCDRRIESDEPIMACESCGNKIMTLYRWDMLASKEKRRIQIAKFLNSFSSARTRASNEKKTEIMIDKPRQLKVMVPTKKKYEKIKGEELPSY